MRKDGGPIRELRLVCRCLSSCHGSIRFRTDMVQPAHIRTHNIIYGMCLILLHRFCLLLLFLRVLSLQLLQLYVLRQLQFCALLQLLYALPFWLLVLLLPVFSRCCFGRCCFFGYRFVGCNFVSSFFRFMCRLFCFMCGSFGCSGSFVGSLFRFMCCLFRLVSACFCFMGYRFDFVSSFFALCVVFAL